MSPLTEPFPAVDPQFRSYGILEDDTGRSGVAAAAFAKQQVVITGSPTAGTFKLGVASGTEEEDTLKAEQTSGGGQITLTGGAFALSFVIGGVEYRTQPIVYSCTNLELAAAINAATGPTGQTLPASAAAVSGTVVKSGVTKIKWKASLGPVTELKVTGLNLTPVSEGHNSLIKVTRAVEGKIEETSALAFNASAKAVEEALEALTAIGSGNVEVAKPSAAAWTNSTFTAAEVVSVTKNESVNYYVCIKTISEATGLEPQNDPAHWAPTTQPAYTVTFKGTKTGPQANLIGNGKSLTASPTTYEGKVVVSTVREGVTGTTISTATTTNLTAFAATDLAAIEALVYASTLEAKKEPKIKVTLQGSDDGTNWFNIGSAIEISEAAEEHGIRESFEVEAWSKLRWSIKSEANEEFKKAVPIIVTAAKLTGNA